MSVSFYSGLILGPQDRDVEHQFHASVVYIIYMFARGVLLRNNHLLSDVLPITITRREYIISYNLLTKNQNEKENFYFIDATTMRL